MWKYLTTCRLPPLLLLPYRSRLVRLFVCLLACFFLVCLFAVVFCLFVCLFVCLLLFFFCVCVFCFCFCFFIAKMSHFSSRSLHFVHHFWAIEVLFVCFFVVFSRHGSHFFSHLICNISDCWQNFLSMFFFSGWLSDFSSWHRFVSLFGVSRSPGPGFS